MPPPATNIAWWNDVSNHCRFDQALSRASGVRKLCFRPILSGYARESHNFRILFFSDDIKPMASTFKHNVNRARSNIFQNNIKKLRHFSTDRQEADGIERASHRTETVGGGPMISTKSSGLKNRRNALSPGCSPETGRSSMTPERDICRPM